MIINHIILNNFRIYKGENTINFLKEKVTKTFQ